VNGLETRWEKRLAALEQDWNRLRDDERDWRILGERVCRIALTLVIVALLVVLLGCESQAQKCERWQALAVGYTMCIKDPACTMEPHRYVRLNEAKRLAIQYCEVTP